MRYLEVRIGELLGKAKRGGDRRSDQITREVDGLTPNERHDFRTMAAHADVVEDVIAGATDETWPKSARSPRESAKRGKTMATAEG
jgi:hypothetical protein